MLCAERKVLTCAAWLSVVFGTWSLAHQAVQADEPKVPCCPDKAQCVPLLGDLPYIGQFFFTVTDDAACAEHAAGCPERIGFDLELVGDNTLCDHFFNLTAKAAHANCGICPAEKKKAECNVSTPGGYTKVGCETACKSTGEADCKTECVAKCKTECVADGKTECVAEGKKECVAEWEALPAAVVNAECVGKCPIDIRAACVAHCEKLVCHRNSVEGHEELAHLHAEIASLRATLDAVNQMSQLREEMVERIATLAAENAELHAQLAFSEKLMAERERSLRESHELAIENLRLKAMVELASKQHAADQETLQKAVAKKVSHEAEISEDTREVQADTIRVSEVRPAKKARTGKKAR